MPASGSAPPGAPPEPGIDTGQTLARVLGPNYEVRGLIGRGGFAEVFEVWDRTLSRRLAAKVLRPDVAWTQGMLARFRDECRVLARLNHPNIVPIHFVGEGEGLTYYAMPYIEGQSLGLYLRNAGALDADRALEIAAPILEALGHAHEAGLLHRDIKPDNVLIDASTGRPLLVDFGIAKRIDGEAGHTQTGFVVGTPQYMSPEQALGQMGLDGRSDLYAFGAMLFQMVTGAPPYEGESSQEIVGKHIAEPVPVPVDRNARIPVWLSDIIVRCLAKRPADRFQSAAALLDAIRAGKASGGSRTEAAQRVAERVSQQAERPELPEEAAPAHGTWRWYLLGALAVALLGAGAWWTLGRSALVVLENGFGTPLEARLSQGTPVSVPPGGSTVIRLPGPGAARVEWTAAPRRTPDGRVMGDSPAGVIDLQAGRGRTQVDLGLDDSRVPMFEPLVTNGSSRPLTVVVNFGLTGAKSCECTVEPGAVRVPVGYYPLYVNTTVRAIDPAGRSAMFRDLGPQVDRRSWTVGLRFEDRDLR